MLMMPAFEHILTGDKSIFCQISFLLTDKIIQYDYRNQHVSDIRLKQMLVSFIMSAQLLGNDCSKNMKCNISYEI